MTGFLDKFALHLMVKNSHTLAILFKQFGKIPGEYEISGKKKPAIAGFFAPKTYLAGL